MGSDDERAKKTRETAELYFKGYTGDKPYDLWKSFDVDMAKQLSLFITGDMYARERIPHTTRQLVSVAALTVLCRKEELKLHILAAINVGCRPQEIAETIFQTMIYGGVPSGNAALKVLQEVLEEQGRWPLEKE